MGKNLSQRLSSFVPNGTNNSTKSDSSTTTSESQIPSRHTSEEDILTLWENNLSNHNGNTDSSDDEVFNNYNPEERKTNSSSPIPTGFRTSIDNEEDTYGIGSQPYTNSKSSETKGTDAVLAPYSINPKPPHPNNGFSYTGNEFNPALLKSLLKPTDQSHNDDEVNPLGTTAPENLE